MKAQRGNEAGWRWGIANCAVNTQQAPSPANPQRPNSLNQSRREGLWGGPSLAAGIKGKREKQLE